MEQPEKCVRCGLETVLCCKKCKRVYYCSSLCQREEWHRGHKYICTPKFEDMLKLKFELEKNDQEDMFGKNAWYPYFPRTCFLSSTETVVNKVVNGERKYIDTKLKHGIMKNICVCCGEDVTYKGPLSERCFEFQKDGVAVTCYRCEKCHIEKRVICLETFRETKRCANINKNNAVPFLLSMTQTGGDFNVFPKEIVSLILGMYSKMVCCR